MKIDLNEVAGRKQVKGIKPSHPHSIVDGVRWGWIGAVNLKPEHLSRFGQVVALTNTAKRRLEDLNANFLFFPTNMGMVNKGIDNLIAFLESLRRVDTLFVCHHGRTRSPYSAIYCATRRSNRVKGRDITLPTFTMNRRWVADLARRVGILEVGDEL